MLQIAIIFFRESLEIALLLSIIFAATKKIPNRNFYIAIGLLLGILLSIFFALFTRNIATSFNGMGQDVFNIILLSSAILLMCWTLIWMKEKSSEFSSNLQKVSEQIKENKRSQWVLTSVIATCIVREGFEIVLFIYSLLTVNEFAKTELITGISLGISCGLLSGFALYFGLVKLPGKYIFKVSAFLLILIAAGLASSVANLLIQTGFVNFLDHPIWDSSWLIKDSSIVGQLLNVTLGYTSKPCGLQLTFFLATIIITNLLIQKTNKKIIL